MQTSIKISALAPRDLSVMRAMLEMFGEAFDDVAAYCSAQPEDDYLARLLGREHFIALVALRDDEVVGGLAAYQLEKFEQQRSEIYIYDLAVAERHRRMGIATALIQELRGIARRRGAGVVFVQADLGDPPAIALYSKLGKREEVLHFDIAP